MKVLGVMFSIPFFMASCEPVDSYHHGYGWMHPGWTGMMDYGWGGTIMLLLLLVVIIVVVYAVMRNQGSSPNIFSSQNETPLDILKKRYARGEITKEEFDRMKNDLS